MLRDKGVLEFVQAASLLKTRGCQARFAIVGDVDLANPASLNPSDIDQIRSQQVVELWGFRSDMESVLPLSSLFVLPSYYGEGLPKVLIEAAACGRPVVTTDHPGCRHAVEPGVTGVLVPSRDPFALADAISELLSNPEYLRKMSLASRRRAERKFDLKLVIRKHISLYHELLSAD